jgi:hypothetical protein
MDFGLTIQILGAGSISIVVTRQSRATKVHPELRNSDLLLDYKLLTVFYYLFISKI